MPEILIETALPELASLNALFETAWPGGGPHYSDTHLQHSLRTVSAYAGNELVGFVNLAWDGGVHAFILDTTVHPGHQRRGLGRSLVERAAALARDSGCQWLHVDYEASLEPFYAACGFSSTSAGLKRL